MGGDAAVISMVVVGVVSTNLFQSCAECRRVGALHADVANRQFPEEMQEALDIAAKEGYYALPTREYNPRPPNMYDPSVDREDELWEELQLGESDSDVPDYMLEAYQARQAEATACVLQCSKISRAVSRLKSSTQPRKTAIQQKGVNRAAAAATKKQSKNIRKRKGVALDGEAGVTLKKRKSSDGVGLLGKGRARK
jgi:hypothetical protein